MSDTTLELIDGSGSLIIANDNWRDGGQVKQLSDANVQPNNDLEAAVIATLKPGGYTAIVRGRNGATGVALVEVYALE